MILSFFYPEIFPKGSLFQALSIVLFMYSSSHEGLSESTSTDYLFGKDGSATKIENINNENSVQIKY